MTQRAILWVLAVILVPMATMASERLDPRVAPTFQSIYLDLDANRTDYSGSVRIELDVKARTDRFLFHAEEMSLDRTELRDADDRTIGIAYEVGEEGLVSVKTERQLDPGVYQLDIAFSKDYNTQAVGLYRMVKDGQGYLFSQFESVDARKAFPCWDEPVFKIPYQLTIRLPIDQEAVTNYPVESQKEADGFKTMVYERSKPLPSYLLAIMAGPFESVPIEGMSVPGRVYTIKGQIELANLATEYAPPILAALENYFGSPYPFEKLDLIAVPEYWPGAMENPGAVTYLDRLLLVDPEAASVGQKRNLARVTAHEFAHMWFGDLVTMSWWDDLWLNESFADWMGDKIAGDLYPQYEIALTELQDVAALMNQDARPSTKPVRRPVEETSDIYEDLGLAYGKGKTVLGMVEQYVGPDTFRKGVISYLDKHAWGNTVAADLFDALSSAAGEDLSGIFSSFLEQSSYPMVSVSAEAGGVLKVSQKRFVNHGVEAEDQQWTVPIRLKYSDGSRTHTQTFLLEEKEAEIHLGGDVTWAMPDAGGFGYYRWMAPQSTLLRIVENPSETLNERERAAFLGNMNAMLNAGEIGGGDYLAVLSRFALFPEAGTLTAILSDLENVKAAFVTDDLSEPFSDYVRRTLRPAFDEFGLEKRGDEAETVSLLRPRLIAWLGRDGADAEIRSVCGDLAKKYLADPTSIDPSIAGAVLNVAAIDGGPEEFEVMRERFENATVPAERIRYLSAMGNFRDGELQDRALTYILRGEVRPNEMFIMIQNVSRTEAGRDKVYKWLTSNWDAIISRMPTEFQSFMPFMAGGCSLERLEAAKIFFAEPEHNVKGTNDNVAKVVDQVSDCVNLREREGKSVADYLYQVTSD